MPFFVGNSGVLSHDGKKRQPGRGADEEVFDRLTATVQVEGDGDDPGMEECGASWRVRHSRPENHLIRHKSLSIPLEQVAQDTADETVRAFCSLFSAPCRNHYRYRN